MSRSSHLEITSRFPAVQGAGAYRFSGIDRHCRLMRPDFGDQPEIKPGQLPVFWRCGVTPQIAVEAARPHLCITHKPGAMLITDKPNDDALAALQ